jgi:hypothetical protein
MPNRMPPWPVESEFSNLLDQIEEYLDDHIDVVDGDDGQPRPNRAMSLHSELTRLRKQVNL